MIFKVILLPLANKDIEEAAARYDERQKGLGRDLQNMSVTRLVLSNKIPRVLFSDMMMLEQL